MNDNIIIRQDMISYLGELGTVKVKEPMSGYTTFKSGGPADLLIFPGDSRSVSEIILTARRESLPVTIIGGGSNLLVGDRGIRGLVISLCEEGHAAGHIGEEENGLIYADSSVMKERFIGYALERGRAGVEFMAGIPGCIGGGIVMNAGTFMGSFIDVLASVDYIDDTGLFHTREVDRSMSDYRTFRIDGGTVITGGRFRLPVCDDVPLLRKKINDILEDRRGKHPLEFPSAGSVFKNPPGHSSWQLVDGAGLKGAKIGGAMVSGKHTNFVINHGGATSREIRTLIELIQEKVRDRFGVSLETEIRMIGEF